MATTPDYDALRPTLTTDDSAAELQARHGVPDAAAFDADENDPDPKYELPGHDALDDELTAVVVPMMADEFRCTRCFLVWHRSQQASAGSALCRDCS